MITKVTLRQFTEATFKSKALVGVSVSGVSRLIGADDYVEAGLVGNKEGRF